MSAPPATVLLVEVCGDDESDSKRQFAAAAEPTEGGTGAADARQVLSNEQRTAIRGRGSRRGAGGQRGNEGGACSSRLSD
jgi:hypothetical protein